MLVPSGDSFLRILLGDMSSRVTRSNREVGLRRTRKRTHNQVGGAPFYQPKSDYFKGEYVDISGAWATKLGKAGVPDSSVTKILELFTYKASPDPSGADPSGADPSGADPSGANLSGADPSGAWLDANKYRNPIMKVGLEIIMEKLNITNEMNEEDILKKIKDFQTTGTGGFVANLKELFTDLEKILTLNHRSIKFDTPINAEDSKLELMFKDGPIITQELSLLLLYPMRIQNILIQSVAEVVIMLKEGDEMEKIKTNVTDDILKTILVNKWANYSTELCMSQTNDNIRDNFAEGVKPTTTKEVKDFWESFVDQLNKDVIKFSETENLNINFGILACEYAKYLKDPSGNDFFASEKLTGLNQYELLKRHKDELPDDYSSIPLSTKLLPASILFLKQLECAVELSTP